MNALIILAFKMGKGNMKKIMIYLIMKNYFLKENQKGKKMALANLKLLRVKVRI